METALSEATKEIQSTKSSLADTVNMINSNIETNSKADKVQASLIKQNSEDIIAIKQSDAAAVTKTDGAITTLTSDLKETNKNVSDLKAAVATASIKPK